MTSAHSDALVFFGITGDLARRLEFSSIPVRAALQPPQSEGLVVTVPHVGTSVASLPTRSQPASCLPYPFSPTNAATRPTSSLPLAQ